MAMRKPVSFIAKFANSFCNRQANLPPGFHRPSASGFVRRTRRRGFLSLLSRLLSWTRVGVALGPVRAKSSTEIFAFRAGRDVSSADRAARFPMASAALNLLSFLVRVAEFKAGATAFTKN